MKPHIYLLAGDWHVSIWGRAGRGCRGAGYIRCQSFRDALRVAGFYEDAPR